MLFTSLLLFFPISPCLILSLACDVGLIEPGAQPFAVKTRLMESTWLTDKPTENKLSENCGLFINFSAMCGTTLTPPGARRFIFTVLKIRFRLCIYLFLLMYSFVVGEASHWFQSVPWNKSNS